MVDSTLSDVGGVAGAARSVTAFFDTQDAADTARADLVAAGISPDTISIVGGASGAATTEDDGGFWHALKEFFMPDEDRYTYAEGLRRGGFALSVRTNDAHYDRALDILDADGAVDIDEREQNWRDEGWTGAPQRDAVAERVSYAAADARTAGFGGSLAGDDGYSPAAPVTSGSSLEAETRGDASRVGTGGGSSEELNPDFRERIGSGTASMTPPTRTGAQDATLNNNAANLDRGTPAYTTAAEAEDAALGSPTRTGFEAPSSTSSTLGSVAGAQTSQGMGGTSASGGYTRDTTVQRARVRGFIPDPVNTRGSGV